MLKTHRQLKPLGACQTCPVTRLSQNLPPFVQADNIELAKDRKLLGSLQGIEQKSCEHSPPNLSK